MVHAFVGARGGVSTTVTAMRTAAATAAAGEPTLLVDVTGDIGVVLGEADAERGSWRHCEIGAAELCADMNVSGAALQAAMVRVEDCVGGELWLLHRGRGEMHLGGLRGVAEAAADVGVECMVDAGSGTAGLTNSAAVQGHTVLVASNCYQALVRAHRMAGMGAQFDAMVYRMEPERALGLADMDNSLGREADAVLQTTEDWARWADLGVVLEREGDPREAEMLSKMVQPSLGRSILQR